MNTYYVGNYERLAIETPGEPNVEDSSHRSNRDSNHF